MVSRTSLGVWATVLLLLVGCSSDDGPPVYEERPVEELYNDGRDYLKAGHYTRAQEMFEEVERQHPYSIWAVRGQVMAAYAAYRRGDLDVAITILDRFIELHPGNDQIEYAFYLKGICYYEQLRDVQRDQYVTRQALQVFDELLERFPNSPYSRDARLKRDLLLDQLAGKEMSVGRYYLERGEYLGAISRFTVVIHDYEQTSHVPEAMARIVESYLSMGIAIEARKMAAVLGHNFPDSPWYSDVYKKLHDEAVEYDDDWWDIRSLWSG